MQIRTATSRDRDDVRSVHWSAFPDSEREIFAKLAVDLLSQEATPQVISLVAETEGKVVGHVAFSPVTDATEQTFLVYILAPLAVRPKGGAKGVNSGDISVSTAALGLQPRVGIRADTGSWIRCRRRSFGSRCRRFSPSRSKSSRAALTAGRLAAHSCTRADSESSACSWAS